MAPAATRLTVEEFDLLYGNQKGWEYWFGVPRQKPVPTYLHGVLAGVLFQLLRRAGYYVSGESDLKIIPDWQPRPDVYGSLEAIEGRYAAKPVDVVFEIKSESDDPIAKCQHYNAIGIRQTFVFNPEKRTIAEWDSQALIAVPDVKLRNGVTITGQTIWREMEAAKEKLDPPPSRMI